jgi:hypothetical protein
LATTASAVIVVGGGQQTGQRIRALLGGLVGSFLIVRRKLAEGRDSTEWMFGDPKVVHTDAGGGDISVRRLFHTSVGPVEIHGNVPFTTAARFDDEGWARVEVWTGSRDATSLAGALGMLDLPDEEAAQLADEMEPLIAARRPEPPTRLWVWRDAIGTVALYAAPWGIGVAALGLWLFRQARRMH